MKIMEEQIIKLRKISKLYRCLEGFCFLLALVIAGFGIYVMSSLDEEHEMVAVIDVIATCGMLFASLILGIVLDTVRYKAMLRVLNLVPDQVLYYVNYTTLKVDDYFVDGVDVNDMEHLLRVHKSDGYVPSLMCVCNLYTDESEAQAVLDEYCVKLYLQVQRFAESNVELTDAMKDTIRTAYTEYSTYDKNEVFDKFDNFMFDVAKAWTNRTEKSKQICALKETIKALVEQ